MEDRNLIVFFKNLGQVPNLPRNFYSTIRRGKQSTQSIEVSNKGKLHINLPDTEQALEPYFSLFPTLSGGNCDLKTRIVIVGDT